MRPHVIAAQHGVTIGYHNHAHELESLIDGRTALDVFADSLSAQVGLEVDTYWALVGGQDPVALLDRLAGRVVAVHVKDGAGTAEPKDQTAVGAGTLPIREIHRGGTDRAAGRRAGRLARRPIPGNGRQFRVPHRRGPGMTGRTGRVGVGFIGAGFISGQYLENLTTFPDLDVRFIADIDTERARDAGREVRRCRLRHRRGTAGG